MEPPPTLNRVDAWLLAALTERWSWSRPPKLWELVNDADWLDRGIPTYDEVSYSLPRLIAAGYAIATRDDGGELRLKATRRGFDLRSQVKARSLGAVLSGMALAVGAKPYPEPEEEDRSLGRLEGLAEHEWDAAVHANEVWMSSSFVSRLIRRLWVRPPRDIKRR
jgi:hypothetical protein